MSHLKITDPFRHLGLPRDAGESELRARYLELVKKHPPDRDPEAFRAIRSAYETARDPLLMAKHLLELPSEDPPGWRDAIERQKKIAPPLSPALVLSLGNREHRVPSAGPMAQSAEQQGDPTSETESQ